MNKEGTNEHQLVGMWCLYQVAHTRHAASVPIFILAKCQVESHSCIVSLKKQLTRRPLIINYY